MSKDEILPDDALRAVSIFAVSIVRAGTGAQVSELIEDAIRITHYIRGSEEVPTAWTEAELQRLGAAARQFISDGGKLW